MPVNRHTAGVTVGFDPAGKMDGMASGSRMTPIWESKPGQHGQGQAWASRLIHSMHQSTLTLGDENSRSCYTTTHSQSYCGRGADGQPLTFHPPDPSFPSQHFSQLVLTNATPGPLQSHTKEVHGPKDITPRANTVLENWTRHHRGKAVREVTNPPESTPYWTTYRSEHSDPVATGLPHCPGGRATRWHRHDILTGEQRHPAGPGKPRRRSGDGLLWAARRWETDCCALRLY